MSHCKLFPPEYDTSRHCGEHGGTAWLYGPNSHRCDQAPPPEQLATNGEDPT